MSKSILNRSLMAAAIATSVSFTYAAPQTVNIAGTLGEWRSFNASLKNPVPYQQSLGGIDLVQGLTPGAAVSTAVPAPFYLSIPVTGSVTFDDVTGVISVLTLTQNSPFTGYYDVDADGSTDDSYANSGAGGAVTYSGLSWIWDANGMQQQPGGMADGCESGVPNCQFTENGINANDSSNGLGQSVFDFQGINAGFQTLPSSKPSGTTYGTVIKTWAETAGQVISTVNLSNGEVTIAVSSRINAGATNTNAANTAAFNLIAVLPQSACTAGNWWNGSACVDADVGYFVAGNGATAQVACSLGNYQPLTGQASCTDASVGSYVDQLIATAQTACPSGQTTATTGSTNVSQCFIPSSCNAGSWFNGTACVLADPGYYVPNGGAQAQLSCDVGTYQATAGQTSCSIAQPGYFVANSASAAQTACSPGSFQPNASTSSCILASANSYVPSSAATSQLPCPTGLVSTAGATQCTLTPTVGDADGDGVSDVDEALRGSNPLSIDSDGDGIRDSVDPFPANPIQPTSQAAATYSQENMSIPGCYKAKRVIGAQISFVTPSYNLFLGDGLLMFGNYKVVKPSKKYQLSLSANSQALLQSDLDAWADKVCGSNVQLVLASPKFDMTVNKQQTQATVSLKATVTTKVNGKVKKGKYTFNAKLPLTGRAPK